MAFSSQAQGLVDARVVGIKTIIEQRKSDSLVTGLELELDALLSLLRFRLPVAGFLVDMELLATRCCCGTAEAVFFVDADFLLVARVAVLDLCRGLGLGLVVVVVDGGREGLAMLFVTFPSDVRRRELCFSFYLDFG